MAFKKKEDSEEQVVATEATEQNAVKKTPAKPVKIKDYPRIKCIIETRDEQEQDLFIGLNEYQCYIQFGKELELPEPVFNMVRDLETIKFTKGANGFAESQTIKRYIVSKV